VVAPVLTPFNATAATKYNLNKTYFEQQLVLITTEYRPQKYTWISKIGFCLYLFKKTCLNIIYQHHIKNLMTFLFLPCSQLMNELLHFYRVVQSPIVQQQQQQSMAPPQWVKSSVKSNKSEIRHQLHPI
jgi:hypothetical protein